MADIGQTLVYCKYQYRYWWPICWCNYNGIDIGKNIGIGWTHVGLSLVVNSSDISFFSY